VCLGFSAVTTAGRGRNPAIPRLSRRRPTPCVPRDREPRLRDVGTSRRRLRDCGARHGLLRAYRAEKNIRPSQGRSGRYRLQKRLPAACKDTGQARLARLAEVRQHAADGPSAQGQNRGGRGGRQAKTPDRSTLLREPRLGPGRGTLGPPPCGPNPPSASKAVRWRTVVCGRMS